MDGAHASLPTTCRYYMPHVVAYVMRSGGSCRCRLTRPSSASMSTMFSVSAALPRKASDRFLADPGFQDRQLRRYLLRPENISTLRLSSPANGPSHRTSTVYLCRSPGAPTATID